MSSETKGHRIRHPALQLGLGLAVSGTVGAFAAEAGTDPMTTVFWRCAFGALFLAAWNMAFGLFPWRGVARRNLLFSAGAGLALGVCWACLFAGFKMTSIATATIVFQSYPFLLILAGWAIWGEKVSLNQMAWIVLAFIGVALASGLAGAEVFAQEDWITGVLLTVAAAACYVVTTILVRGIKSQRAEVTMMIQAMVGAVLLSFAANFHQTISPASWGWLAGIGVIHSGLAMVLMYATYPLLPTRMIAVLNFIYPAVAIVIDWLIYHHPLTLVQIGGLVLIVFATLGATRNWSIRGKAS